MSDFDDYEDLAADQLIAFLGGDGNATYYPADGGAGQSIDCVIGDLDVTTEEYDGRQDWSDLQKVEQVTVTARRTDSLGSPVVYETSGWIVVNEYPAKWGIESIAKETEEMVTLKLRRQRTKHTRRSDMERR